MEAGVVPPVDPVQGLEFYFGHCWPGWSGVGQSGFIKSVNGFC